MSSLILPRRFYSQPPGAVEIDWSNPITRGLFVAFNFCAGPVNLVTGGRWTATSMSGAVSPLGDGLKAASSTTGNITGPTMNMARLPGAPNDVLSVCWGLGSIALADWRQMWGQDNGAADANLIHLSASGYIQGKFGGGASFTTAAGALVSGESCNLALIIKSTAGARLIKNGTLVLHNSASNSYPANVSAVPHIFGSSANTRRLDTQIPYWYAFGRVLDDAEVREIASSPWQIFRAKPRVLYFDVGGSTSPVTSDLVDSYAIRAAITSDMADSYAIRAAVSQDLGDSYGIRAGITSDLADSYEIESIGTVISDLADSYAIRAGVSSDLADSYAIRAGVASDLADSFSIRAAVSQDLADSYTIITAVTADLEDSYAIRAAVAQDLIDSYTVFSGSGTGATAEEIWAVVMDGSLTASEMMRIMFAALAGKREGIGTATERYYGQDGVTPRITLTPDQYGNGTPVVDGS